MILGTPPGVVASITPASEPPQPPPPASKRWLSRQENFLTKKISQSPFAPSRYMINPLNKNPFCQHSLASLLQFSIIGSQALNHFSFPHSTSLSFFEMVRIMSLQGFSHFRTPTPSGYLSPPPPPPPLMTSYRSRMAPFYTESILNFRPTYSSADELPFAQPILSYCRLPQLVPLKGSITHFSYKDPTPNLEIL